MHKPWCVCVCVCVRVWHVKNFWGWPLPGYATILCLLPWPHTAKWHLRPGWDETQRFIRFSVSWWEVKRHGVEGAEIYDQTLTKHNQILTNYVNKH